MLMERDVLTDCMPFAGMAEDDDLDIELGDTDLKIRLAQRTKFDYVDECLVFYRQEGNKLWTGPRRFKKVKQNIEHQSELYGQYPSIRRQLLHSWYQKHGTYWLEERAWSATAIMCFLKSMYYADGATEIFKSGVGVVASLFGRPGWSATMRLRDMVDGSQREGSPGNV
jgi:hypothetical protein